MTERKNSIKLNASDREYTQIHARSNQKDQIQGDLIITYNHNCQQDQYNVKLYGVMFDAIGAPDFFLQNDVQNSPIDITQ